MAGNGMSAREVRGKDAARGGWGEEHGASKANQHRHAAYAYADFFFHVFTIVSVSHPTVNG